MAQAISKAVKLAESHMDGETSRVFPLEGSGSKKNGYDYLLIGVEITEWINIDGEEVEDTPVYEIAVHCNESTGWKVKAEIKVIHLS